MNIHQFWQSGLAQDDQTIRTYFHPNAYINWHCTNEHFTVEEFIQANCEYPGEWDGKVERIIEADELTITVTHVYTTDHALSFHVTSFIRLQEDKIITVDEYWADDGDVPQWRKDRKIGRPIKERSQDGI